MSANRIRRDALHNSQLREQIKILDGSTVISKVKARGACALLLMFFTIVITINVYAVTQNRMNNNFNDSWSIDLARLNYSYSNCLQHYTIGGNIILSQCNNTQFGPIVDIRYFLNEKATIIGIAIPMKLIANLSKIINEMITI